MFVYSLTAVVTVDFSLRPEKTSTLLPFKTPSTTWPPVTFVYVELVSREGTNCGVVVKADPGTLAFRTWYCSTAAITSLCADAALPSDVLKNWEKALLLGARIVIPEALVNDLTRAG